MEYEIMKLEEKKVVGISARTNNAAPDMETVIGGLWGRFFQQDIYGKIPGKVTGKTLGIYTDYDGDEKNDYTIVVACETENTVNIPDGCAVRTIPAGTYARFIVKGDMHQAVAEFWAYLWASDLPRNFVCDYEEYQNESMDDAEIHMYIGLREEA